MCLTRRIKDAELNSGLSKISGGTEIGKSLKR